MSPNIKRFRLQGQSKSSIRKSREKLLRKFAIIKTLKFQRCRCKTKWYVSNFHYALISIIENVVLTQTCDLYVTSLFRVVSCRQGFAYKATNNPRPPPKKKSLIFYSGLYCSLYIFLPIYQAKFCYFYAGTFSKYYVYTDNIFLLFYLLIFPLSFFITTFPSFCLFLHHCYFLQRWQSAVRPPTLLLSGS